MISRKTSKVIGEAYKKKFTGLRIQNVAYYGNRSAQKNYPKVFKSEFYDFLYEHDYAAWFCNKAQKLYDSDRAVLEFIMRVHTGETQADVTPTWTWEEREKLGQTYLENLASDFLNYYNELGTYDKEKERLEKSFVHLNRRLELDGYIYRNKILLVPESDILDTAEESGVLESLYTSLVLANKDIVLNHLDLSEKHYVNGDWTDSITNSRNFLEGTLREVAANYSKKIKGVALGKKRYESASQIRNYLENEGLLESKEKNVISSIYGLLSSHRKSSIYGRQ